MGPPAIPKGTPHPATFAVRPAHIPIGKVWVQGKLRDKASKAAKHQRLIDERRAERVLRRSIQGQKIFAYSHIRTKQVVYSLSRFLEENKVLTQLLDHGKKTRPASLRKDMWTPFFSIQFPTSKHGLVAYKQLKELSTLRQLSPPKSMITNTEASHIRFHPSAQYDTNSEDKIAPIGQIMPPKQRARVLMDQKASSVADVAFVLDLQGKVDTEKSKPLAPAPDNHEKLSKQIKRAMRKRREVREQLEQQFDEEVLAVQNPEVPLSDSAKARIVSDHVGFINDNGGVSINPRADREENQSTNIHVLWADLRDAAFAKSWPSTVYHGELQPKAELFDKQRKIASSVHVIGSMRNRDVEAQIKKTQNEEENKKAALQAAEERARQASSRPPASARGVVEPPPKGIGSRVADTLMFWR